MTRSLSSEQIAHAFGLPPWVIDMEREWPLRQRALYRLRHPRRWWRWVNENRKARD